MLHFVFCHHSDLALQVGPSASGKSSLAKLAAALTGHSLKILAMNSAMDTTELLGGFEQVRCSYFVHYVKHLKVDFS